MRGPTLRARTTLLAFLVTLVLASGAALLIHALLEQQLVDTTATLTEQDLDEASTAIQASAQHGHYDAHPDDSDGDEHSNAALHEPPPGVLLRVVDADGTVVVDTLPLEVTASAPDGEDHAYLVRERTVTTADGSWHLTAARSTATAHAAQGRLTPLLVGVTVLVVALVTLGAWILSGLALRPVMRLRDRAAELARHAEHDDLLPVGASDDELARLAVTLNELLLATRESAARERAMVAAASHELKTPLAVLRMQLELARDHRGNAEALAEDLAAAHESAERMTRLTGQLLELSKLDAGSGLEGRGSGTASLGELESELWNAVDRGRLLAATTNCTIDADTSLDAEDWRTSMDAASFGRILDNAVSNALDACGDEGEVQIDLRSSGDHLALTVRDTGHGIDPEFLPRAFDRFARADESRQRTSAHGGAGLGLALVHAIVTRSGGTVSLGNRPSGGAELRIELPLLGESEQHDANM